MKEIEKLYRLYFKDVYKYLRSITHDESLSEELLSDTFFKAMQSFHNFRGECDVRVWLCQIAKNLYFSHLKKYKKQAVIEEDVGSSKEISVEELLCDNDSAFEIHQILHNMKEPYKEVFSLRVFGELTFRQIGTLFGKTEHWACVTYHRARNIIIGDLENEN